MKELQEQIYFAIKEKILIARELAELKERLNHLDASIVNLIEQKKGPSSFEINEGEDSYKVTVRIGRRATLETSIEKIEKSNSLAIEFDK